MSTAMEKMVANMLGFSPEMMHETLSGFSTMITDTKATLERIEAKLDYLYSKLERTDNDNGSERGSIGDGNRRDIGTSIAPGSDVR